jgi:hypothetical protein
MSNIRPFGGVGKRAEPAPPATYYAVCATHGVQEPFTLAPYDMRPICPFCLCDYLTTMFPVMLKETE